LAPKRLDKALDLLAKHGARVRPIAGGTDVLVQLKRGTLSKDENILLNVKNIPQLTTIKKEKPKSGNRPSLRIGAAVTMRALQSNEKIRKLVPVLAEVANKIASEQIRAVATIGGNVANASPSADLAIPLLLLDAEVETARLDEKSAVTAKAKNNVLIERTPVEEFFVGPGETSLSNGALVTGFYIRCPEKTQYYAVKKGGVRPSMECAVVSAGCGMKFDADGTARETRVAFGAVAPTPIRAREIENLLNGKKLTGDNIDGAVALVDDAISPIDDVRGTKEYRSALTKALLRTALHECATRG
jgi:CO/xanthine dehydrogenase FAD-binding subunit